MKCIAGKTWCNAEYFMKYQVFHYILCYIAEIWIAFLTVCILVQYHKKIPCTCSEYVDYSMQALYHGCGGKFYNSASSLPYLWYSAQCTCTCTSSYCFETDEQLLPGKWISNEETAVAWTQPILTAVTLVRSIIFINIAQNIWVLFYSNMGNFSF